MSVASDVMDRSLVPGVVHEYGDQALLLEFDSTAEVLAWTETLRSADLLGVVDIVPASRTVLIKLAGPRYQAPTRQRLGKLRVAPEAVPTEPAGGRVDVTIDVVYDGADLHEVAERTGLSPAQVVAAHTGTPGGSDSVDSHRVSPTWWAATNACGCRAGPNRARVSPPGPWRWPVSSAASIHGSPRAAGS